MSTEAHVSKVSGQDYFWWHRGQGMPATESSLWVLGSSYVGDRVWFWAVLLEYFRNCWSLRSFGSPSCPISMNHERTMLIFSQSCVSLPWCLLAPVLFFSFLLSSLNFLSLLWFSVSFIFQIWVFWGGARSYAVLAVMCKPSCHQPAGSHIYMFPFILCSNQPEFYF